MSLAALLNGEGGVESDVEVEQKEQRRGTVDEGLKVRFLEELNEEFGKIERRDAVEVRYQDWKFLNYQEFELINEWNGQSKAWGRQAAVAELLADVRETEREWERYEEYGSGKVAGAGAGASAGAPESPGGSAVSSPSVHGKRRGKPGPRGKRAAQQDSAAVLEPAPVPAASEEAAVIKSEEVVQVEKQTVPSEKMEDKIKTENGVAAVEEVKENGEEVVGPSDSVEEFNEYEEFEEDDEDDDFLPNKKLAQNGVASNQATTMNKNVTIESEKSKIVRELIKMCNKNRVTKARKRRFTNAIVTDYDAKKNQLILKVTLKQYHVRQLKRLINESNKKNEELNQKDEIDENDPDAANKKRKLNDGTVDKLSSEGLSNYGLALTLKEAKAVKRHYDNTLFTILKDLARKDSAKIAKLVSQSQSIRLTNIKKNSALCAREAKKWQQRNFKQAKDCQTKARRGIREMLNFWKKNEREERDMKKKIEKEAQDNARKEEEERENKRQTKKLNFLLTQTELYSHFIGSKIKTNELEGNMKDERFEETDGDAYVDLDNTTANKNVLDVDNDDDEQLRIKAAQNASNVLKQTRAKTLQFDNETSNGEELNFQNPTSLGEISIEQPSILACTLKEYQLKGLNWLANLYDQGINGILADEMGLGKTVQSISVLAHLAERYNIWGPFLVVTPASTLHNWVNEIAKFVPSFKILPYWGNASDRKILRRFWDRKNLRYGKDAPFHVMITSYQMVVSDSTYLQKIKWQYMILDEAQAIKSSQSSRWKNLLSFYCRNRLLLTGTPIQNNMQELWALLHFIMPSLFDSHDEFNDWFSKDIESHAEANTKLNQQQLRRLHMILKPFMLRRVKKNVQSELGEKIEIDIMCDLTQRQSKLYQVLKSQMTTDYDAVENAAGSDDSSSDQNMINAVMQFRKVCNHPDLFERTDITSPFSFASFGRPFTNLKDGEIEDFYYSSKNPIAFTVPRLIYDELLLPNWENNKSFLEKLVSTELSIIKPSVNPELVKHLTRITGQTASEIQQAFKINIIKRLTTNNSEFTKKIRPSFKQTNSDDTETTIQDSNFEKSLLITDRVENLKNLSKTTTSNVLSSLLNIKDNVYYEQYFNNMQPGYTTAVSATPISLNVPGSGHSAIDIENGYFDKSISQALSEIPTSTQYNMLVNKKIPVEQFPVSGLYPTPLNKNFSSHISMPSMDRFITESAKLKKLDELLIKLKKGDHRVLIYFQMTRMMDLMEEYLTYRQYNHIRLDGSSKLEDRRDLVHDWQTRPEIFIFLLSTRAGGLGINLTAADTVIFYDSDWNPTIDSQAMDRAHRLGQTRQVTVYRLLVRDTIEERMRDRAKQKEHVQQVVMEGKTKGDNVKTI